MLQQYDRDATRAAILYVAQRVAEPTFHKIGKVLYFADRNHLEQYGRLMFGDTYNAFKHGPLPSNAYRELSQVRERRVSSEEAGFHVTMQLVRGSPKPAPVVVPEQQPDLDELSRAALACLDASIEKYGHRTFDELVTLSHDAAWHQAWNNRMNEAPPMPIETLVYPSEHRELLLEYIRDPLPGEAPEAPRG